MSYLNKIKLFNVPIDVMTMEETLNKVEEAIKNKKQLHHCVINAGKVSLMKQDPELYKNICKADIIHADGMPIVWVSRWAGKPLPERVSGVDLMENLIRLSYSKGYTIFFLGAKEEVVHSVVTRCIKTYSSSLIAGYQNGYYTPEEETSIAQSIAKSGANILFVAMSSPIKENFLYRNKEMLSSVNFIMGVGGSFDVYAGLVKRAPNWMQNVGLEWAYRFMQEPRRFFYRYTIRNFHFIGLALREILTSRWTPFF